MTGVIGQITATWTAIMQWVTKSIGSVVEIFYTSENGLTFLGTLSVVAQRVCPMPQVPGTERPSSVISRRTFSRPFAFTISIADSESGLAKAAAEPAACASPPSAVLSGLASPPSAVPSGLAPPPAATAIPAES